MCSRVLSLLPQWQDFAVQMATPDALRLGPRARRAPSGRIPMSAVKRFLSEHADDLEDIFWAERPSSPLPQSNVAVQPSAPPAPPALAPDLLQVRLYDGGAPHLVVPLAVPRVVDGVLPPRARRPPVEDAPHTRSPLTSAVEDSPPPPSRRPPRPMAPRDRHADLGQSPGTWGWAREQRES